MKLTYQGEIPVKKNTQRISKHGGIYKPKNAADFEETIGWEWRLTRQEPVPGTFKIVSGAFYIPERKDLDGCLTSLLDALQYAGAIENDRLLRSINDLKKIPLEKGAQERLEITIEAYT